jgi:hypothetical protein
MRGQFAEFGARTVIPVTTRRRDWRPESETVLLDFSTTFVRFLIETMTSSEFGGAYGAFENTKMPDFFAVFLARYQNDQGRTQGEKLIIIDRNSGSEFQENNRVLQTLLDSPQVTGSPRESDAFVRKAEFDAARDRAEVVMAQDLSRYRHPNDLVIIASGERSRS